MNKPLAVILAVLLLSSPVLADAAAAIGHIDAADAKLVKVQDELNRADGLNLELGRQLNQKDVDHAKAYNDLNDKWKGEYAVVQKRLDDANDWTTKIMLLGFAGLAVTFAVLLALALLLKRMDDAIVCGIVSGVAVCASLAIQHYGQQIAAYSGWGLGLLVLMGVGFVIVRGKAKLDAERARTAEAEAAGIEHANTIPLLEKAGVLAGEALAKAKRIAFQETGPKADELAVIASGKPIEQIRAEAGATGAA